MNAPIPPNENPPSTSGINQQVDNSSLYGGQQAAIGDHNTQIQGDKNWVGNVFQFFSGSHRVSSPVNSERLALIAKVKREVEELMERSLLDVKPINLQKQLQPQYVTPLCIPKIKIGSKPTPSLTDENLNKNIVKYLMHLKNSAM